MIKTFIKSSMQKRLSNQLHQHLKNQSIINHYQYLNHMNLVEIESIQKSVPFGSNT